MKSVAPFLVGIVLSVVILLGRAEHANDINGVASIANKAQSNASAGTVLNDEPPPIVSDAPPIVGSVQQALRKFLALQPELSETATWQSSKELYLLSRSSELRRDASVLVVRILWEREVTRIRSSVREIDSDVIEMAERFEQSLSKAGSGDTNGLPDQTATTGLFQIYVGQLLKSLEIIDALASDDVGLSPATNRQFEYLEIHTEIWLDQFRTHQLNVDLAMTVADFSGLLDSILKVDDNFDLAKHLHSTVWHCGVNPSQLCIAFAEPCLLDPQLNPNCPGYDPCMADPASRKCICMMDSTSPGCLDDPFLESSESIAPVPDSRFSDGGRLVPTPICIQSQLTSSESRVFAWDGRQLHVVDPTNWIGFDSSGLPSVKNLVNVTRAGGEGQHCELSDCYCQEMTLAFRFDGEGVRSDGELVLFLWSGGETLRRLTPTEFQGFDSSGSLMLALNRRDGCRPFDMKQIESAIFEVVGMSLSDYVDMMSNQ